MFDKKPKGRVDIIVSKMVPKEMSEDKQMEPKDDKQMEYESAAEEIISAIDSKDAKALAEALHAFYTLCDSSEEAEPADEEE